MSVNHDRGILVPPHVLVSVITEMERGSNLSSAMFKHGLRPRALAEDRLSFYRLYYSLLRMPLCFGKASLLATWVESAMDEGDEPLYI